MGGWLFLKLEYFCFCTHLKVSAGSYFVLLTQWNRTTAPSGLSLEPSLKSRPLRLTIFINKHVFCVVWFVADKILNIQNNTNNYFNHNKYIVSFEYQPFNCSVEPSLEQKAQILPFPSLLEDLMSVSDFMTGDMYACNCVNNKQSCSLAGWVAARAGIFIMRSTSICMWHSASMAVLPGKLAIAGCVEYRLSLPLYLWEAAPTETLTHWALWEAKCGQLVHN